MTATFAQSGVLGAANLRGTGYATRDIEVQRLSTVIAGEYLHAEVNVTGLAGFLLAKIEAAYSRRQPKDWYDIAFVLIHNDRGGPEAAASAVLAKFSDDLKALQPAITDLGANFADGDAQGSDAYVSQIVFDHPDLDPVRAGADAMLAVEAFIASLREGDRS